MKIANQSVTYIDHCGSDLSVVNAARVSFHKESTWEEHEVCGVDDQGDYTEYKYSLNDKDAKLIKYLAKHKHKSPFNHCFMSFRVKAPIFVARQLVKHEYLPWNEVSRRYVTEEPEFYFPDYWRKSADNVKQGSSSEATHPGDYPENAVEIAYEAYKEMLLSEVCAEQARMILPQNTMTEWIWSGTLFAFAKMCKLRLDSHTQKETREIAVLIDDVAKGLFPVSWEALMENYED